MWQTAEEGRKGQKSTVCLTRWCARQLASKKKKLICSICWFPWYKYSHQSWFQTIHVRSLHIKLGRHAHNLRGPAHHHVLTSPLHLEHQLLFPVCSLQLMSPVGPALATYSLESQGPTQSLAPPLGDLIALVLCHAPLARKLAPLPPQPLSKRGLIPPCWRGAWYTGEGSSQEMSS